MVLCSGVFDGLHAGHVHYLLAACEAGAPGEPLIVAVASDAYVDTVKGHRSRWTLADRQTVLQELVMVDAVVAHGVEGAASAIRLHRPRLFVKGREWDGHLPPDDLTACLAVGAQIVFVDEYRCAHTSDPL